MFRNIPPPLAGPRICGIDGGPFKCYRISSDIMGPFSTDPDFYQFLYGRVWLSERSRLEKLSKAVHTRSYPIRFSHNDFAPFNVLIDQNYRLSGIVDWECAGWFPEYWEYTRSHFHRELYTDWQALMDAVFGRWKEELEVERELWTPW